MSQTPRPGLSLGPVPFLWSGEKWRDFHFRIADEAPVSHVTLGETVCSKRLHFTEPFMADVIERLERAGKTVILASLAVVTLEREIRHVRMLAADSPWMIEAGDLSALHLLSGKPHAVSPLVNVYNGATARLLAGRGARIFCLPPELPMASIRAIRDAVPDCETEVLGFGRMPLALSARCAHARSKGLIKDNCQFVCGNDPDGLPVRTMARQPFLALNGIQTLSHSCQALIAELPALAAAGITRIRLSPQDCDMVGVARLFDDRLEGRIEDEEARRRLSALYPDVPLSNGFIHGEAGAAWIARSRSLALAGDAP